MSNRLRYTLGLAALLIASLFTSGCEEDVAAVLGTDRVFTLYGVLNPKADTQFVRVFPIEGRLVTAVDRLDAVFTSTDLVTGEAVVWQDSLILQSDGDTGHVFWAPFRVAYGHAYRLEIRRSDGAASVAEVMVPEQSESELGEPTLNHPVILPIHIRGNVPRLLNHEVELWVMYNTGYSPAGLPILVNRRYVVPLRGREQRLADGWVIRFNLSDAYSFALDQVQRLAEYDREYGLVLLELNLRGIAANEEWDPPGGTFDPELLVQPDIMTNVENGFGFVGAGYPLRLRWLPVDEVVAASGFRPFG